jgi:hypothetical protein
MSEMLQNVDVEHLGFPSIIPDPAGPGVHLLREVRT